MMLPLLLAAITLYAVFGLLFVACAVVMAGRSPHPRPVPIQAQSRTRART
jgi:hypothetical protein